MCPVAVELLKRVAERGEGDRGLTLAKRAFEGLDHHAALMQYLRLSAMGVEVAQSNAAWMLKHGYGYACCPSTLSHPCMSCSIPAAMHVTLLALWLGASCDEQLCFNQACSW